jgi:hypothetical protein
VGKSRQPRSFNKAMAGKNCILIINDYRLYLAELLYAPFDQSNLLFRMSPSVSGMGPERSNRNEIGTRQSWMFDIQKGPRVRQCCLRKLRGEQQMFGRSQK